MKRRLGSVTTWFVILAVLFAAGITRVEQTARRGSRTERSMCVERRIILEAITAAKLTDTQISHYGLTRREVVVVDATLAASNAPLYRARVQLATLHDGAKC